MTPRTSRSVGKSWNRGILIWELRPNNITLYTDNVDFLVTGDRQRDSHGLKWNGEKKSYMLYTIVPLLPMTYLTTKIGIFQFLNATNEAKKSCQSILFCLAVFRWSNTCICNSNFGSTGWYPLLRVKKNKKFGKKYSWNYRKFQNILEEQKWRKIIL